MIILLAWTLLGEQIPEGPFAYQGKGPREIILFDKQKAPHFDAALSRLLFLLPENASEQEILTLCNQYVSEELFDRSCPIDLYVEQGKEVPLEIFLENKAGICRHFALTTTLLIDQLIKQGRLEGEAYLIRDETPKGRHAWTLFLSKEGAWHLDPYWGFLKNGKEEQDFLALCQKYGKRTMERQKSRWEKEWR